MKKVQEKQHHDKEKGNCLLLDKTTPAHRHTGRQGQKTKSSSNSDAIYDSSQKAAKG